jgi:ketosteroid isomerase-like protein
MTARKKAARKATSRSPAATRPARSRTGKPAARAGARAAATPEQVAQKLVKLTIAGGPFDLEALYTDDCISREATGEPTRGRAALEAKFKGFEAMVRKQRWKARHVFVSGNTVCIEWQGQLELADGRRVALDEVAIHELHGGKISAERFYYDPSVLAPPTGARRGGSTGGKREPPAGPPPVMPEFDDKPPPIDPLDL